MARITDGRVSFDDLVRDLACFTDGIRDVVLVWVCVHEEGGSLQGNAAGIYARQPLKASCASYADGLAPPAL
jgi:hypothetical protein